MVTTILFDLDGTLTDPKEGITKCVQYALKAFGIHQPDLEALTAFIGPPLQQQFMDYCGWDEQQGKAAVEAYRERFATVGKFENKVYPGIESVLKQLQTSGKRLAVATSKPEVFAKEILEHFHLASYFTCVVGSELDGTRVKKVEVIAEVLRQLKVTEQEKEHVVMVGDRDLDVLAAKCSGIRSVAVTYGFARPGELEQAAPDFVAQSVEELGSILLSI